MYDIRPNLIIGFHGCDEATANQLVNQPDNIQISKERYDWLGHGFYFWENNYQRALKWAVDKKNRGKIDKPAVVGAVINLGYCCDLIDSKFIDIVASYYQKMKKANDALGLPLPENKDIKDDEHKDKVLRQLDCAVIEFMHSEIQEQRIVDISDKGFSEHQTFESTRGVFVEGGPAFEGAGFKKKNHIQVCIRNPNCIKGFFMPRKEIDFESWLEDQKK